MIAPVGVTPMLLATVTFRWVMHQVRPISKLFVNFSLREAWKNATLAEDMTWIAGCSLLTKPGDRNLSQHTSLLNITHYI